MTYSPYAHTLEITFKDGVVFATYPHFLNEDLKNLEWFVRSTIAGEESPDGPTDYTPEDVVGIEFIEGFVPYKGP